MIQDGNFDSKVIGIGLATIGLFVIVLLALPILFSLYAGSPFDTETRNVLLYICAPALILLVVGVRLTARVSERFLGLVCVLLGGAFVAVSIHIFFNPLAFENTDFGSAVMFGSGLMGVGLSKLLGMKIGDRDSSEIPITRQSSVVAGAFDFIKVFGLVLFLGLIFPALVVGVLIGSGYVVAFLF